MTEWDVAREKALERFAESTRDTLLSVTNVIEIQEQRINALEQISSGANEWVGKAQDLIVGHSKRLLALEERLRDLERQFVAFSAQVEEALQGDSDKTL